MTKNNATKLLLFSLCLTSLFFFASQTIAAQSSPSPAKTAATHLKINAAITAKSQEDTGENSVKKAGRAEILSKALRVPLGEDFMAYFSLELPHGIEAVREELENKTAYRAVFGVNIPL